MERPLTNPFVPETIVRIPESEIKVEFVRSSGPGGQKVNKTSTKAQLRWNIDASTVFSSKEKALLKKRLAHKLTKEGEIVLSADTERSQLQNKMAVIARLQTLVRTALIPKRKRIATKPTRGSKERRLSDKKKQSRKKKMRKADFDE